MSAKLLHGGTPSSYHPVIERLTPPPSPPPSRPSTPPPPPPPQPQPQTQPQPQSQSQRRFSDSTSELDELTCACCYDILREPTTLTCGHTFCRSCIATWYLQSKQTLCPECRQKFYGVPQINIMIRLAGPFYLSAHLGAVWLFVDTYFDELEFNSAVCYFSLKNVLSVIMQL